MAAVKNLYFTLWILFLGLHLYGSSVNLVIDPEFNKIGNLPSSYQVIKGGGRSGGNALLKQRSPGSSEYQLFSLGMRRIKPNTAYQFSVWVKAEDISLEFAEACNLEFYRKGKFQFAETLRADKGSYSWKKLSTLLISGDEEYDNIIIVFFLQRRVSGKIWFSEPSLKEIRPDLSRLGKENGLLSAELLPPSLRPGLNMMKKQYLERMKDFRKGGIGDLIEAMNLTEWNHLRQLWSSAQKFEKVRPKITLTCGFEDVILGVASGAEKILPNAPGFKHLPAKILLSAARNEKESVQLILLPTAQNLKQVTVAVSDLKDRDGNLWKQPVRSIPVGYVRTRFVPASGTDYIGFYPDPLMEHLHAVNFIRKGHAQSFWLRLSVPWNQPKGIYSGNIEISMNGKTAFRIPFSVRVYDFTLPRRAMLPLAITFLQKEERLDEWTDMLSDYLITPDNLYNLQFRREDSRYYGPDFNLLSKLKKEGKLNRFNLGYVDPALDHADHKYGMQFQIERIRPRYEEARRRGLLEYAYIYGCDESSHLVNVERTAKLLKAEFPDVPLFTSAVDFDFGMTGKLSSWDWFCPLIPFYGGNGQAALERARKNGKQVWWYICCVPARPFPNVFIESRALEIRLLMGMMAAKYKPDGFLYYETTKWGRKNRAHPLGEELFTAWDPNSFGKVNGDGYLFYLGPDKRPLPSLRVENFRDGLEDYAYYKLLEEKANSVRRRMPHHPWLREAENTLQIPENVVKSLTEYAIDPQLLAVYRNQLAEKIELAPEIIQESSACSADYPFRRTATQRISGY